ncbi:TIR domain-containing protein [Novosphingobium pituita]|uniref:TIR domain-containing protein n=1 Tax=Novosphingobium pituita TaxID=3056842 RepID=UPI00295E8541|nr:TIR domain-containing protein [Novosphingobium sp. IK01]
MGAANRTITDQFNTLPEAAMPAPKTVNPFMLGLAAPKIRRVFYSFHYQADIFRVNHIRKAGQFRALDKWRTLTPHDRSLWEEAKLKNPSALMRTIDKGLEGTSVTCVLAGYETWNRQWVRYEIAKSLQRGNGLVVVTIHNCKCPNNGYALPGLNPLAQMAVGYDAQNKPRIYERFNETWRIYPRLNAPLSSWPKWLDIPQAGHVMPLSSGARCYDWITDGGRDNLLHWTDAAAIAAGR